MDQIFERLERLVRAWTNFSGDEGQEFRPRKASSSGDADLDAAMAELDDYLDTSKTETERREAQAARERQEAERRAREGAARGSGGRTGFAYGGETRTAVEEAYRYLGLAPYVAFPEVKAAYKKLLLKYHPDRNAGTPEALKRATETSARINAAYQIIETYEASRTSR